MLKNGSLYIYVFLTEDFIFAPYFFLVPFFLIQIVVMIKGFEPFYHHMYFLFLV